jgi:hypothetical protein
MVSKIIQNQAAKAPNRKIFALSGANYAQFEGSLH